MKLKLPTESKITLNLSIEEDPQQEAYVIVRQATQREVERRAEVGSDASRIFREGDRSVEVRQKWNYEEQKRIEAYLTLVECNLTVDFDGEDKPLFRFSRDANGRMRVAMTEQQFKDAWGFLPENIAEAIHKAVIEVNPQWGPNAGE